MEETRTDYTDDELRGGQEKFTPGSEEEIQGKLLDKEDKLKDIFSKIDKLKPFWEKVQLLFSMIKDYKNGLYREIPFKTIASLAGALIYVLSPVDLIPDFIPGVGFIDDAALLALVFKSISSDLEKYRIWKGEKSS